MKAKFAFEAYGVKIGLESNSQSYLRQIESRLDETFPMGWKQTTPANAEHRFVIDLPRAAQSLKTLKKAEETLISTVGKISLEQVESKLRLTVAEFTDQVVFIHGGAVAWKGMGVILPGKSFAGKSTLVAEFIKRGFTYYSDEYAVLTGDGKLLPFTKTLSIRGIIDSYRQKEIPAEEFGARKGRKPIPVGCILVSQFKTGSRIRFKKLTPGAAIIEIIANSVSIRRNPKFVLETVNRVVNQTVAVKTKRPEAKIFADKFMEYFNLV